MNGTSDPRYNTGDCLRDAFRFIADASFAVFPRDTAYKIGEFEKNFWGGVRWLADRASDCVDDALAGGDRLRSEWQRKREGGGGADATGATGHPDPTESPAGGI
jgi:hypothetical protein